MNNLYLLQFACFLFMLFNALVLLITRMQAKWISPRYERSRRFVLAGIIGMAAQFFAQMCYGFRATNDAMGATINILIYTPCFSLIALGIYHIEATHMRRWRIYVVSSAIYAAIVTSFVIGYFQHDSLRLSGKVLGMFFLFHSILYLCIMNMLEQLARLVLPKEILDNFDIVKIETDESDIDAMSMTIHLDERMNAYLQKSEDYESKGFMDAVRITDFPIRDHKVILVLRRRRWKNKETGETFVDRISVSESGTRYSKEFAAFLKETYGHIPDDLPYA